MHPFAKKLYLPNSNVPIVCKKVRFAVRKIAMRHNSKHDFGQVLKFVFRKCLWGT